MPSWCLKEIAVVANSFSPTPFAYTQTHIQACSLTHGRFSSPSASFYLTTNRNRTRTPRSHNRSQSSFIAIVIPCGVGSFCSCGAITGKQRHHQRTGHGKTPNFVHTGTHALLTFLPHSLTHTHPAHNHVKQWRIIFAIILIILGYTL